ncbi:unnamed protein product [Ilex paraguariensis]|uniref:Aspartate racemase n=1 Tax=Ilex paraguariensis TaxID=185542 RepID=A0ABC8QNA7_9AQUA
MLVQTEENGNLSESTKIAGSGTPLTRCQTLNSPLNQAKTVGIIGGVSVFSTLIFLEKLVWWSSRNGEDCVPFIVCNDPVISRELSIQSALVNGELDDETRTKYEMTAESLRRKRAFLEQSGVHCIVMPCHISEMWHSEVSEGCSVPFLSIGDCVARDLKEAELKPLEAGSKNFEVVLPDKATVQHILNPAIEALNRKDVDGARNLLRVAVQVLLMRAANTVILATDEFQGLLPHDDPLLKKCIDPMDALALSTLKWARST